MQGLQIICCSDEDFSHPCTQIKSVFSYILLFECSVLVRLMMNYLEPQEHFAVPVSVILVPMLSRVRWHEANGKIGTQDGYLNTRTKRINSEFYVK